MTPCIIYSEVLEFSVSSACHAAELMVRSCVSIDSVYFQSIHETSKLDEIIKILPYIVS